MQFPDRRRRSARVLVTALLAATFVVVAGGASGADDVSVGAAGEPQLAAPAELEAGQGRSTDEPTTVLTTVPTTVPAREYDESALPRHMQQMATERWYESGVDMGYTIDCAFGTQAMLGRSWVGWWGDLTVTPTANQVYYTKIGWGVSGGCGGSYVAIEEFLPPGSQLAITPETPVVCWYDGLKDNELKRFTGNCPQQPGTGQKGGLSFNNPAVGAWETAIGTMFEIWIPIKSTQPLNGLDGNPCKSCLQAALWFIDGVSNPWGYPKIPVYVKGNTPPPTPSVSYPAPSVRNTSCCTAGPGGNGAQGDIAAWFFTTGKTGTTEFQIDDEPGAPYDLFVANGTITQTDLNNYGQDIEQWLTLFFDPDTQYYWRACFTPTGGTRTCGREQTFNVPRPPDTSPPETTIVKQPAADSESRSASFDFSSSKAFSTFKCRLDGGAWEGCAGPKRYTDLADGQHTFEVHAVSQAGVADSTPASYTWTVNPAPETTITSGPPAKTRKRSATFAFTATEATKSFKCRLDDGRWKTCSAGTVTYTRLSRTKHTFAVKAVDLSGKVDRTPATRRWTVRR